jgi:heme/copper-type cytochrome/quinol oxidase subunit 3
VSAVVNSVQELADWELSLFSWADSCSVTILGHPCSMHKFTQKDRDCVASNMFLVCAISTCFMGMKLLQYYHVY